MTSFNVLDDDANRIASSTFIPWEDLRSCNILITGATGLIGSSIIRALCNVNRLRSLSLSIVALTRDIHRGKECLKEHADVIRWIEGDVVRLPDIGVKVDYIIHGAGPTSSAFFSKYPVETIESIVFGTRNLLELARKDEVKAFVFLSSMEVYGSGDGDNELYESTLTVLDQLNLRSCYPEAKRLSENLCVCYCSEYAVPARIVRLSQTFGPGVPANDNRVFAQFAKAASEEKDIVLHTKGDSKRPYLYTADAVTGIMTVLLKGEDGQAYNAGNPNTYLSIMEMANTVATKVSKTTIKVKIQESRDTSRLYPPSHSYNLNVDKLKQLGWTPTIDLIEMYQRMIKWQQHEQSIDGVVRS